MPELNYDVIDSVMNPKFYEDVNDSHQEMIKN